MIHSMVRCDKSNRPFERRHQGARSTPERQESRRGLIAKRLGRRRVRGCAPYTREGARRHTPCVSLPRSGGVMNRPDETEWSDSYLPSSNRETHLGQTCSSVSGLSVGPQKKHRFNGDY